MLVNLKMNFQNTIKFGIIIKNQLARTIDPSNNLILKPKFSFSIKAKQRIWSKAYHKKSPQQSSESILKTFFSNRLTVSTHQLQSYIIDLSYNGDVKIKDHRWQSLYMSIEKHHNEFSYESKIQIIQALGRMKQNNSLYITLYKSIVAQLNKIKLNQLAILLWSMIKVQQIDKNTILAIYKKLYYIIENNEKIILYRKNQKIQTNYKNQLNPLYQGQQQETTSQNYITQSNFTHLIWALQKTNLIDKNLIIKLLKMTLKDEANTAQQLKNHNNLQNKAQQLTKTSLQKQESSKQNKVNSHSNLEKIIMQNLCLLMHTIVQLELQKYKIVGPLVNKIIQKWQDLQSLSVLSLVLLCQSFSKFVLYQQKYLVKYGKDIQPSLIDKKNEFIKKQKNFIFLIVQTILMRQDEQFQQYQQENSKKSFKKQQEQHSQQQTQNREKKLKRLINPLSAKFSSLILLNLARINLYNNQLWYKILKCITYDIDHVQIQDLSMSLVAICNIQQLHPNDDQIKRILYPQKKIICRRIFQIYNSLTGKSLGIIKRLIFQKKLQNQLVPSRIRKLIQAEYGQGTNQKGQENKNSKTDNFKQQEQEIQQQDTQQSQQFSKKQSKTNKKSRNNFPKQSDNKQSSFKQKYNQNQERKHNYQTQKLRKQENKA